MYIYDKNKYNLNYQHYYYILTKIKRFKEINKNSLNIFFIFKDYIGSSLNIFLGIFMMKGFLFIIFDGFIVVNDLILVIK